MEVRSSILVAEPEGFIGSAIVRSLHAQGYRSLLLPTASELDLHNQEKVQIYFEGHRPEYVFHAAGPSGGIRENMEHPAQLMHANLEIGLHLLSSAAKTSVKRLVYVASSCIYPRNSSEVLREGDLLTGPFEPTNESYSVAKLAILKLCQAFNRERRTQFITLVPANPYGPEDSFDPKTAHVITALLRKMHEHSGDSSIKVWGTGKPRRDFLYVDDLAEACLFVMKQPFKEDLYNVSAGTDISIGDLARQIAQIVGFKGKLEFDSSQPDGMPVKLIDGTKLKALGWKPMVSLAEGIQKTYEWFRKNPPKSY